MRPQNGDRDRDWDSELDDAENPRPDVQRLRAIRRRAMAMRPEARVQMEKTDGE